MFLEVLAFGASQVVLGAVVFLAADRFLFFLFESNKVNVGFVNGEAGLDATLSFLTSNVSLISTTRSSAVEKHFNSAEKGNKYIGACYPKWKSDIESHKNDPINVKHLRSVSSLSGTSSHAFHPSSVTKSTLDSSKIPIEETYVPDPTSTLHRENQTKNNTITENEGVVSIESNIDSGKVHFFKSSNIKEPAQFLKVKDEPKELGNDNSALTACSVKEGTSIDPCIETTNITEAQLDAILEGEVDQTFSSSSNADNLVSLNVQSAASKSFRTLMFPLLSVEISGNGGYRWRSVVMVVNSGDRW
nr:hypothetical protein [Tanacetum cinerariifolium]